MMNGLRQETRAIVVAALISAGLAAPAAAAESDSWITTKSKLALLTTEGISSTRISVDTNQQEVTLHGTVDSTAEKATAEKVVRGIDGVRGVKNALKVVAATPQKTTPPSDAELTTQVQAALHAQTSLKDSAITVESVKAGHVVLAGTAQTMTDHLSAAEVASEVPGVRRVTSNIHSPTTLADKEVWHDRAAAPAGEKLSMGDASRDVWITSMAKMRLLSDARTPGLGINVDSRAGVVTLFGIVATEEAKRAAEADVRLVSGVTQVHNDLQVVATKHQPAVKAKDADIQRNLEKGLQDRADLKGVDIEVKNCIARLTGTVPSGTQRLEAAVVARATVGVCAVQDDLQIAN